MLNHGTTYMYNTYVSVKGCLLLDCVHNNKFNITLLLQDTVKDWFSPFEADDYKF